MRKLKIVFLSLVVLSSQVYAQEQLVFAVDLIRHGDRTPYVDVANPAYQWPQGLGELTALGMQQEYQLGQKMRKTYVDQYHLLPPSYTAATMYVRSSDFNRTLMSAQSFLFGLYPLGTGPNLANGQPALPAGFQPIPIHTVALSQDPLFQGLIAEERKVILKKYVFTQKAWQEKEAALQPQFAHWSQATGVKITSLDQLIMIGDALYIRQSDHVPMPPDLTDADVNTIINAGLWAFLYSYQNHDVGNLFAHSLLMQINQYISDASQKKTPLKYVLLSAHDSTALALMSAMHVPLSTRVPYASDINFMLFKDEQSHYFVKVSYNGQALALPGCDKTECTLQQFMAVDQEKT